MSDRVNIIAEGDSWFSLTNLPPIGGSGLTDVIHVFSNMYHQNKHRYNLVGDISYEAAQAAPEYGRHALPGETIQKMTESSNIKMFRRVFERFASRSPIKAMIFSGGGNDLIGEFVNGNLLKQYKKGQTAQDSFDDDVLNNLKDAIKVNYRKFINLCEENDSLLIAHSYYPPNPIEVGISVFLGLSEEPKINNKFNLNGYPPDITNSGLRQEICDFIIQDVFIPLLDDLKREYPNTFDYVDVTSLNIDSDKDHLDEMHFNHKGCKKVAQAFVEKLDAKNL